MHNSSPKELLRTIDDNFMNQSSSRVIIMMDTTEKLEDELGDIMRYEGLHVGQEVADCDAFDINSWK
jgi:hypothetical protein